MNKIIRETHIKMFQMLSVVLCATKVMGYHKFRKQTKYNIKVGTRIQIPGTTKLWTVGETRPHLALGTGNQT